MTLYSLVFHLTYCLFLHYLGKEKGKNIAFLTTGIIAKSKKKHTKHILSIALDCVHINTSTSPALYGFPYTRFRQTRVYVYFNGGRSHTYEYGLPESNGHVTDDFT